MPGAHRVPFAEVWEAWGRSDEGKDEDTRPILRWVNCYVNEWMKEPLTPDSLSQLRLIGGDTDGKWGGISCGTFLVRQCSLPQDLDPGRPLALVCVEQQKDKRRRVLIDGNMRAILLWKALHCGREIPRQAMLYVGHLDPCFEFAAAAVSSIWR